MNKKKEVKKDKDKKQIADDYSKKITYSTSESEKLDLLDIVEMYLCKSCVRKIWVRYNISGRSNLPK